MDELRYTRVVLDPEQISLSVTRLLEEIRCASNSLLKLAKPHGLALKMGLQSVRKPLLELLDLQVANQEEVGRFVPHFAPKLADAYHALAHAEAHHRDRSDLDMLTRQVSDLLGSLDEPLHVISE
jgi:hypothetical protein